MKKTNNDHNDNRHTFLTLLADLEAQYATINDIFDECERRGMTVTEAMAVVRELME